MISIKDKIVDILPATPNGGVRFKKIVPSNYLEIIITDIPKEQKITKELILEIHAGLQDLWDEGVGVINVCCPHPVSEHRSGATICTLARDRCIFSGEPEHFGGSFPIE